MFPADEGSERDLVRLLDEDGTYLGIRPRRKALALARDRGLDLILVQPDANPPVAKLMDYGRFKFNQEKKARETKRKHHLVDVKEIKMRYNIGEHDYGIKIKQAQAFLADGDRIKVLTNLRGREIQHKDLAITLINRFADDLKDLCLIDRKPKVDGKSIILILAPISKKTGGA